MKKKENKQGLLTVMTDVRLALSLVQSLRSGELVPVGPSRNAHKMLVLLLHLPLHSTNHQSRQVISTQRHGTNGGT